MILKNNIVDTYFRTLNGNTQVNASEIRNMPVPSIEKIREVGQQVIEKNAESEQDIHDIIVQVLNIKNILMPNEGVTVGC